MGNQQNNKLGTSFPSKSIWWGIMLFVLSIGILFPGCKPDDDTLPPTIERDYRQGVLILNEGNYNWGNASFSFFDADSGRVIPKIFETENNRPLGDVLNSITLDGDRAYLLVNNSGKIEVVDRSTFASLGQISGLNSPRHLAIVGSNQALVTDLYSDSIALINLADLSIKSQIPSGGWTEELLFTTGFAFVTKTASDQILIVDVTGEAVVDSITVVLEPISMVLDKHGKIWILCTGGFGEANPALIRIDPNSRQVEATHPFPNLMDSPSDLRLNASRDTLYWLNEGLHRMAIDAGNLPSQTFIAQGSRLYYGFRIDPGSGMIYLLNAVDYVQAGWMLRYRPANGVLLDSFRVGIIPGDLSF